MIVDATVEQTYDSLSGTGLLISPLKFDGEVRQQPLPQDSD